MSSCFRESTPARHRETDSTDGAYLLLGEGLMITDAGAPI